MGGKGRSANSCLFSFCPVEKWLNPVSYSHLHGSKRSARHRLTAGRRCLADQKTVYLLKLLVIFLKKLVMFFKKLVVFSLLLAGGCSLPLQWLIICKVALDKKTLLAVCLSNIKNITHFNFSHYSTSICDFSFMWQTNDINKQCYAG